MNDTFDRTATRAAWRVLGMNTFAFTVCFACWMMYGVLITYLVSNGVYRWDDAQIGWLIGVPVLTGAIFRLPIGIATDKWGGRPVFTVLLALSALPMFMVGYCDSYGEFLLAGLGFGFTGTSFAVGIAYTSVWFPKKMQGTALGIFGAGNAGAAATLLGAPAMLNMLTDDGANLDGWRQLPGFYAVALLVTAGLFWFFTTNRIPEGGATKTMRQRLAPLKHAQVWRFGLYYFFVFGGFVSLAGWLVHYYVNVYALTIATAGFLASFNTLPSGVIRAAGGWMSDKWGARAVMYWVFGICIVCCAFLIVPRMDIESPGRGVQAKATGTVLSVADDQIVVESGPRGDMTYKVAPKQGELLTEEERRNRVLIFPRSTSWQEPVVKAGDKVKKKELLARGVTHIFFQANVWVFTILSLILGAVMGIGKAGVYKHIPDYFPNDVGVVGGIVGVLGGLGGFICPVIFGYLLKATGLWTTCWMFFLVLTSACLIWMHIVIRRRTRREAPTLADVIEEIQE